MILVRVFSLGIGNLILRFRRFERSRAGFRIFILLVVVII